jgi:superfamily I DNA and/or RNA helicase
MIRNYRSHPKILHLYSSLFYGDELTAHGNFDTIHKFSKWDGIQTPNFPIIFHGIEGKDEREAGSPSWFNSHEVMQVLEYIQKIMKYYDAKVSYKDFGVITPYRKQVQRIKKILNAKGMEDVSVGSVEEFQGQERSIIIISTVRSTSEYMPFDSQFNIGFLNNPKRFNVAISRAKALLIVVGNPKVLMQDPYWEALIKYCEANNSCVGEQPSSAEEEASLLQSALAEFRNDIVYPEKTASANDIEMMRLMSLEVNPLPQWRDAL